MNTIDNTIDLVLQIQALCDAPQLARLRLGFQLQAPFNWSIINAASTLMRLEREDYQSERGDQIKVKLATLRHFARLLNGGGLEISMAAVRVCIQPEKPIEHDRLKLNAKERIMIERRNGKLGPDPKGIQRRYQELYLGLVQQAEQRQEQNQTLLSDIMDVSNATGDELYCGDTGRDLQPGTEYDDILLADIDQYSYVVEGLRGKCSMPLIRAREELERTLDRTYLLNEQRACKELLEHTKRLADVLGLSWNIVDAEQLKLNKEIAELTASEAAAEQTLDEVLETTDLGALVKGKKVPWTKPVTYADHLTTNTPRLIKSPERLKREQANADAHQKAFQAEQAEAAALAKAEAAKKAKAAKAAATRKANAAAKVAHSLAEISSIMPTSSEVHVQ